MDYVNFGKNTEKVNKNLAKKKTYKKEDKANETKSTEASSLNALSAYSQAMISFKGNVSSDDFEKRLNDIKEKIKQTPENYGHLENSLKFVNKDNISFVERLCSKLDTPFVKIKLMQNANDYGWMKCDNFAIDDLLKNYINAENVELANDLCFGKDSRYLLPEKTEIRNWSGDVIYNIELVCNILKHTNSENIEFAKELCFNKNKNDIELFMDRVGTDKILQYTNTENVEFARELCFGKNENGEDLFWDKNSISRILEYTNAENIEFARKLCFGKDGDVLFGNKNSISEILEYTNAENIEFARKLCFGKEQNGNDLFSDKHMIGDILKSTNAGNIEFAKELCFGKDKNGNDLFSETYDISSILKRTNAENIEFARKLCFGKDKNGNDLFSEKYVICDILRRTNAENIELAQELCFGKDKNGNDLFPQKDKIKNILECTKEQKIDVKPHIKMLKEGEITPNLLIAIFDKNAELSLKDVKKLKSVLGFQAISNLSVKDLNIAAKMIDLANKKDINEIDLAKKKSIVRNLVSLNTELYSASDELKKLFPLIPSNKEEYCSTLKTLCKSMGIQTNELTKEQINKFDSNLKTISTSLSQLTDEQFNNLEFEQEYPKEKFIKNTFEIVKDLSSTERQKVYDYFGFELKHNDNGTQVDSNKRHSFSIIGYPVNLNNGKKLTKIENENTKAVVEKLRPEVIKFSQNNHVSCQNKKVETNINEILNLCPEIRTQIGRTQHGTHSFDVFKHSLKVMQKVAQNPKFLKINESDKKILLLASLLHDSNKAEGHSDSAHPAESAFDAFYITKKFALNQEEANKLYALIKSHEWLDYTNSKKIQTDEEKETRIKSVAYDLHYDNLFELSKILTEADLKAVKNSDCFYDEQKDVFITNTSEIEKYINELKITQPLLPVTKIPSATRIKEAITSVNSDGSTNLKGIYQDNKGMVIIKFNEVENETWEKIGFPKGSVSKGIDATGYCRQHGNEKENIVNTGNIKFFAHGLDYSEQMRNFDAFTLPDSDALLSVSYMERPESKYKLFRTQGLLLDVDTKYIHGGGETDSGSGCKKSLDIFKKNYAFSDGFRHSDREYVANLIKETLKLTDDEYIEFVKNNANKPISEIEPKEYQEPIIKAFATINSNIRRGERSYNEMYVTNPKTMGVFAYSSRDSVENVIDFVKNQQDFLKNYALEENLPFIVFGD